MNQKIMSYIPKSKIEAIRGAYKDEDGYWICLNEGWEASRTDSGCRTIHEDTIKDLRYQIAGIQRVTSEEPEAERKAEITAESELKEIQESMTEAFYQFCTGEPAPENWQEIVQEERNRKPSSDEAVEIILEDITQDPEYHDTPIPPRDPEKPTPGELTVPELKGPGAAEAVMFGLMAMTAVTFWGLVGAAQLLVAMISAGWQIIAPRARAWIVRAIRRLPEIRTGRAAVVVVRMLPVLLGTAALLI